MRRILVLLALPVAFCAAGGSSDADKLGQEDLCREACELKVGHLVSVVPPDTKRDGCSGLTKRVPNKAFRAMSIGGVPWCQCLVRIRMPHRKEKAGR